MLPARRIVGLAASLPVLLLAAGCVTGGRVIQDLGDEARYRDSLVYAGTR